MLKNRAIFIVILIFITSCKSSKITDNTIANLSARNVIKKHQNTEFKKRTLKATLTVKYSGKQDLPSLNASIRIQKDSVIWISFSKLGFQVAKILITPTQVKFYEKLSKSYFEGDFELISEFVGSDLDFTNVQNLFFGEALVNLKDRKYQVSIQDNYYALKPKKNSPVFHESFWIDPFTFKLVKEEIKNSEKQQILSVLYKDYEKINESLFPKGFVIEAIGNKNHTKIDVSYRNIVFNAPLKFPFKLPSGYSKKSFNERSAK